MVEGPAPEGFPGQVDIEGSVVQRERCVPHSDGFLGHVGAFNNAARAVPDITIRPENPHPAVTVKSSHVMSRPPTVVGTAMAASERPERGMRDAKHGVSWIQQRC